MKKDLQDSLNKNESVNLEENGEIQVSKEEFEHDFKESKKTSKKKEISLVALDDNEDDDDIEIKDNSVKETRHYNDEFASINTKEKSKVSIFLLILCLLVLTFYGFNIFKGLDLNNFSILEFITSSNVIFTFISLIVVLILFKVNNKKTTPYVAILTLVLVGYTLFSVSYSAKTDVYVLDFINKDVSEMLEWADSNNIKLEIEHDFSDTIPKNHIIMQQYGINTLVKDITTTFKVTVSDGPNYDKTIIVPNMTGLSFDEVMKYIKENNLSNVEVEFTKNEALRDTLIEQVGSGSMRRNDKIVFKFSYGNSDFEKIPVKDLTNLSEFEATCYLKRNMIDYVIEYKNDDNVENGYVISQSITDKIVDGKLTLYVSRGATIKVPDLLKMTSNEITKWAMENNINIKFIEEYNKEYESGKIIKVSKDEGEKVSTNETIEVTISKGSMVMPKVTNISEFKIWANENNLKYEEAYEFSDTIKKGEIIKTYPEENSKLNPGETITLTISQGKKVTIPNFIGMSKSNIQTKCKSLNLSCTFSYGALSETVKRDIATNQSKKQGTVVAEGANVTITLSSGIVEKVNVPSFVGKTKSQVESSCKELGITCKFTYNSDFSEDAKDTVLKQDKTGNMNKGSTINLTLSKGPAKSYEVIIFGEDLRQGNPEETKNNLQKLLNEKCEGKVNFVFKFEKSNSGIGYLSPNSKVKVGKNTFVEGQTYEVIINSN